MHGLTFADGTTQFTATLQGPAGPQGAPAAFRPLGLPQGERTAGRVVGRLRRMLPPTHDSELYEM